jgi:cupin 2 domain-containing protein
MDGTGPAMTTGNIFAGLAPDPAAERFEDLLSLPGVRIERIVSCGQASPPDFWYDQPQGEWVLLLDGAAGLHFEGEDGPRPLKPGDYVWIAPHRRHRVAWTAPGRTTVWLAIHVDAAGGASLVRNNGRENLGGRASGRRRSVSSPRVGPTGGKLQ